MKELIKFHHINISTSYLDFSSSFGSSPVNGLHHMPILGYFFPATKLIWPLVSRHIPNIITPWKLGQANYPQYKYHSCTLVSITNNKLKPIFYLVRELKKKIKKMVQEDQMRKGPWTEQEDLQLVFYVKMFGDRRWDFLAKVSGLKVGIGGREKIE